MLRSMYYTDFSAAEVARDDLLRCSSNFIAPF